MPRSYKVLGVVGRGGFGTVYRAKLLGHEGFQKDVAIKVLKASRAKPRILARFRDEARMLGLARDRALVAVDPPTRLDESWAVVMEFVDGVPLEQLLEDHGPLPVGVVVEVVREVARALDAVYHQRGPSGEPLRLLHRDLKPSNLQLTPTGEVKILDFGIARADFAMREAKTLGGEMSGTQGYMAPERLEGQEGPEGDVFSLGRVMRRLLTGDRPVGFGGWRDSLTPVPIEGTRAEAFALAQRLATMDPEGRPSMREVEDLAHALLRQCDDPPLRRWAEEHVPPNRMLARDERVGTVLIEADTPAVMSSLPPVTRTPAPVPSRTPAPATRQPEPERRTPSLPRAREGRSSQPPPPRGRKARPSPPTPPPAPPPVGKPLKTVKPTTMIDEAEDPSRPLAAPEPEPARSLLPAVLAGIPLVLCLLIALILGTAAGSVNGAESAVLEAEDAFVDTVRLEMRAIGYELERNGAPGRRVQGDIDAFAAEPSYAGALALTEGWQRLLKVLPAPSTPREEQDRRELKAKLDALLAKHEAVGAAEQGWREAAASGPGALVVALGLAERPRTE